MADHYGMYLSKPFYDVTKCAEADLIFSSDWPSLPIANVLTLPVTSAVINTIGNYVTLSHGQSYPPLVQAWLKRSDGSVMKITSGVDGTLLVDKSSIYISLSEFIDQDASPATSICIYVYEVDISTEVQYQITKTTSQRSSYDPNYSLRIAKPGKDIGSTDLRDFMVHSQAQSPLILAVRTQASVSSGTSLQYIDRQGYLSWVFGYVKQADGKYKPAPYFAQAYPITTVIPSTLLYRVDWSTGAGDVGATLVMLRDPMFAATDVEATY